MRAGGVCFDLLFVESGLLFGVVWFSSRLDLLYFYCS